MMESNKNVVQLKVVERSMGDVLRRGNIPAPFTQMKEKGEESLQPLLQTLFDNVDDALFELADRSESNSVQSMYFDSMREVRIKRRGIETGFIREIDEAFRALLSAVKKKKETPHCPEQQSHELSLMEDEDLDELVAFDAMVAKATLHNGRALRQLTVRINTLVEMQAVTDQNNPFGPEVICRSFFDVCKSLELNIKAKLVLFKLFDRYVIEALASVYKTCNQTLIEGGILPKLPAEHTRAKAASKVTATVVNQENSDVFASLQTLLHSLSADQSQSTESKDSGLVAPGSAPQIPRESLLQLLQKVQHRQAHVISQQEPGTLVSPQTTQLDVQEALNGLLQERMPSQAMSIGQVDDDAINLVAMLFQFILDDHNLATPMKAIIARLQIPILKVAMQDKSFFDAGTHPARELLNEIAMASLGWVAPAKIERDPLYKKIESIVNTLLNDLDSGMNIFQDMLAEFLAFLEVERRRSNLVEQRTLDAEDGKAKSEIARATVRRVLNEKIAGLLLPETVENLLQEAWSNVLFLLLLKEGEQSKSWIEALSVVDELLWSVKPIATEEDKGQLAKRLPDLLDRLRCGLTQISYNPFDMNHLFEALDRIHHSRLTEECAAAVAMSTPTPTVVIEPKHTIISPQDELALLDAELGGLDDILDMPEKATEPDVGRKEVAVVEDKQCFQQVDQLSMGNWVEVIQDNNKKYRCRLAAIIRGTGKYIFVNRSGMKVAEYSRDSLRVAIEQQKVFLLDDGLLFDRALESVIGNLRTMKDRSV